MFANSRFFLLRNLLTIGIRLLFVSLQVVNAGKGVLQREALPLVYSL